MSAPGQHIYFLSDFHLGAPDAASSLIRERRIVAFLEEIRKDAAELFILGDMFDFWYEYRRVVPKGHVRLLGCLAGLADQGIPLHFFVGNHDMWMRDYLQREIGMQLYFGPASFERSGKRFYIAHGDGLGPGDQGYKMLKKVFRNPFCQWLFGILPPQLGMGLAHYFSRKSREATGSQEEIFLGEDQEWLISHCREVLGQERFDYLVFGHRHLPIDFDLGGGSRYINLGDWIRYFTYARFDGRDLVLRARYPEQEAKIIRR